MSLSPQDSSLELLDVVDATDRVVGRAPRGEVHRLGLRHRAAHILVFNAKAEVFVQRRAWWKECQPGRWDTSAAGHLDAGEDYAVAAVRELEEELGLRAETGLRFLCRLEAGPETGNEFVNVYSFVTEQEPRPDPHEIIEGRWCAAEALEAWMAAEPQSFTAAFREIWNRYRQR